MSAEVRVQGVVLKSNSHVWNALRGVKGIGKSSAYKICAAVDVDPTIKTRDLTSDQVKAIQEEVSGNYLTEGDLIRSVLSNIKRLKDIKCYRGNRHFRGLPCRGQKTKTNARTRKGRGGRKSDSKK